ncbi:hypothetical protein [Deinococcus budaensis]|uniref:RelA/SpoT domain-containing protein n=1 Tax=Deinococcus budaensis TaxID=1665626 RepID=A0A7W8GEY2_9DEIO|nr:hypothetical protein [Deinococcus budaensis]MBB5234315.1 hypothetical protein [Deinococcus budaensis]
MSQHPHFEEDVSFPATLQPLSADLRTRFPLAPADVQQDEQDVERAYAQALELSNTFLTRLTTFGEQIQQRAMPRPSGIKTWERTFEKADAYGLVPLDILAGKYVFQDLRALYGAACRLEDVFQVRAFQDRFLQPQPSGYRDLQFVVTVEGHCAEVKLCHAAFDELDSYEHDLYKIRRKLEAKVEDGISVIERLVLDTLIDASTLMFQRVWKTVSGEAGE